jgi:hypothetical protein
MGVLRRTGRIPCEKKAQLGKHRTKVTEGIGVLLWIVAKVALKVWGWPLVQFVSTNTRFYNAVGVNCSSLRIRRRKGCRGPISCSEPR